MRYPPVRVRGCEFEPSLQNNLQISLNSVRRDLQIDAMTNLASSRWQIIAYWVTTALVVFELALGGVWDVLRVSQVRGLIERLGYPLYFLVILGIWKLLGAVALVIPRFPRLKEWAYAGVIFDLTGAVASLSASGLIDAGTTAYPIAMMGVTVASWALRPPSRRLPALRDLTSHPPMPR